MKEVTRAVGSPRALSLPPPLSTPSQQSPLALLQERLNPSIPYIRSPSNSTPGFLDGPPCTFVGLDRGWHCPCWKQKPGEWAPGQSVLPTGKERNEEISCCLQHSAPAGSCLCFMESPSWLVHGGNAQQCLLPK